MQWIKQEIDSYAVRRIKQHQHLSTLLATILSRRAVSNEDDGLYYFNERTICKQHNPFLLSGIMGAIQRIHYARIKRERILIFGDRDADGMTATTVLQKGLSRFGVLCHEPPRVPVGDEQYGLSSDAVQQCVKENITLIVTVDCGISNHNEIALAKQHNIDTIVLDHHNIPEVLPPAISIINPKQDNCDYPYSLISGCVIAYKFILALQCYDDVYGAFAHNTDVGNVNDTFSADVDVLMSAFPEFVRREYSADNNLLDELLCLSAVSTIADMMPMLNENRLIVTHGIRRITKNTNKGLHALMRKQELLTTHITARSLAFNIIPLLNAAGRLGHADLGIRLLLGDDEKEVDELADRVIALHKQQRLELQKIWHIHYEQACASYRDLNGHFVLVRGDTIPNSITGLLANRLQREFDASVIVIARGLKKISGSIRCTSDWRATDFTQHFAGFFSNWGGHDRAAGFHVLSDQYDKFIQQLLSHLQQRSGAQKSLRVLEIDAEISREHLTDALFDSNDQLEPFGQGFPPINYYTKKVVISDIKYLGKKGFHVKLLLHTGAVGMPAIFWNCKEFIGAELKCHNTIDIVYNVEYNYFRQHKEKRLSIIDVAHHGERTV